jgi:PIN domain nuclease of toxin-antitoxin system
MRVLLDTHIFLWLALDSAKISSTALTVMANSPERYLSIASVWEMQIKHSLGKLPMTETVKDAVSLVSEKNDIQILPITQDHIYALVDLPPIYRDPFDGMLFAQAQQARLMLVTADEKITQYAVQTIW